MDGKRTARHYVIKRDLGAFHGELARLSGDGAGIGKAVEWRIGALTDPAQELLEGWGLDADVALDVTGQRQPAGKPCSHRRRLYLEDDSAAIRGEKLLDRDLSHEPGGLASPRGGAGAGYCLGEIGDACLGIEVGDLRCARAYQFRELRNGDGAAGD